jgi:hypothetical protein
VTRGRSDKPGLELGAIEARLPRIIDVGGHGRVC